VFETKEFSKFFKGWLHGGYFIMGKDMSLREMKQRGINANDFGVGQLAVRLTGNKEMSICAYFSLKKRLISRLYG